MKILVVDDDPMAGMLIGAILEEEGHEVINVDNGVEASEVIDQDREISVVVSDMHMPLISGIDLYQTLREQGVELPFVLLTGNNLDELRSLEPGIDACLQKDDMLADTLPRVIRQLPSGTAV